jgi:hypothetical protein
MKYLGIVSKLQATYILATSYEDTMLDEDASPGIEERKTRHKKANLLFMKTTTQPVSEKNTFSD